MHSLSAALREIANIPGARYSCVTDEATGDLLAEHGEAGPDPERVVAWGASLRAALRGSGALQDVMVTTGESYHLLRLVHADSRSVLVHLSVDRARGNLARARRTLEDACADPGNLVAPQALPDSGDGSGQAALPVRTPRRPDPQPERPAGSAGPLSAVPPPRRPAEVPPVAPPADDAPATDARPALERTVAIPDARGWSDDLYTMGRLLDALRRMK